MQIFHSIKVTGGGIDFMVSHAMITTIQRLVHLKRGPRHNLSPVRHHGSGLQIHQGGCKGERALFHNTPTFIPLIPILVFPCGNSCHPELNTEQ